MIEPSNCEVCGEEFIPERATQILCGNPECKRTRRLALNRVRQASSVEPMETECAACGKTFTIEGNRRINCSSECTEIYNKESKCKANKELRAKKRAVRKVKYKTKIDIPKEFLVRGLISNEGLGSQISNGGGE